MANYSAQTATISGVTATMNTAAADGDAFTNDGSTIVIFANAGASPITVTFVTPATVSGVAVADPTFSVGAGATRAIAGPFPEALFNDANGRVAMNYSTHTDLTFAVIRIP